MATDDERRVPTSARGALRSARHWFCLPRAVGIYIKRDLYRWMNRLDAETTSGFIFSFYPEQFSLPDVA
ncbi:hypothetical protein SS05631_c05250 [Sinorhizobium sp. CCBAU 05631]|nr:hypothetical protein SS05631_c05250 [Sinorhizobium sp. CCBAU 05631]